MSEQLAPFVQDSHTDSTILAERTLDLFEKMVIDARTDGTEPEKLLESLQNTARKIVKSQPNKVLLRRTSGDLTLYFKRLIRSDKQDVDYYKSLLNRISQWQKDIQKSKKTIATMGSKIIAPSNKVMIIGKNELVDQILLTAQAFKRRFEVYQLISQPPGEGVESAEFLAGKGIRTTLLADCAPGTRMAGINLVLIGADRIYEQGFVSRAGTLPLCLTARHFNVPVYLAVETWKILKETERAVRIPARDSAEIYNKAKKHLFAENFYQERVPLELVHKVISEEGAFETFEFINWYLKG